MKQNAVSVALCTFNGARYLRAQVASIWAQTQLPAEIVAVDDGSSDGTYDLLLQLSLNSPVPMRVERNPSNLGYVANFERALDLCHGEVVFLCDQDDVWDRRKIETTLVPFDDPCVVLVHSDAQLVDEALRPLPTTLFGALRLSPRERYAQDASEIFRWLLKRNSVTGASCAVRRRLIEIARPFEPGFVHDEWLALIACVTGRVVRLDRPLLLYRQHAMNQIGVPTSHLARLRKLFAAAPLSRCDVLARLTRLQLRLQSLGLEPGRAELKSVVATLEFAHRRCSLPAVRVSRLPGIVGLLMVGAYHQYARGFHTALRDLIESPSRARGAALGAAT
jgi:hypothetical protein